MKKGEAASFVSRDLSPCFPSLPSPVSCFSFPSSGSSPLVPSLLSSCCDTDVARIFPPWDLLRGRDVFRDSEILEQELDDSSLVHWAPNCATFSTAREIQIKNVPNPPRPLRSLEYQHVLKGHIAPPPWPFVHIGPFGHIGPLLLTVCNKHEGWPPCMHACTNQSLLDQRGCTLHACILMFQVFFYNMCQYLGMHRICAPYALQFVLYIYKY